MLQRDIFIKEITKKLEHDKDIYFLSADFLNNYGILMNLEKSIQINFIHWWYIRAGNA